MEASTTFLENLNNDLASVVELVRRSLVQISNGRRGAGAGVVWREDGVIITNALVIRRESPEVILPDGGTTSGKVLALNTDLDLAALHVSNENLTPIEVRDSNDLSPGEWVFALGHPWGVAGAATGGVVIGFGAQIPENPRPQQEWIAVNLPLRPGHSGGALVDAQGRLIGINAIMSGPSVGLAIPAHVVEGFLQEANI
jgi:S1-C subfamily serine protease